MTITITINQEQVRQQELADYDSQYQAAETLAKAAKEAYWKFLKSPDLTLTIVVSKPPPDLGIHVSDEVPTFDKFGG